MARRRLDAELVRRKIVTSRAAAQDAIAGGDVEVDGIVATKSASQVEDSASIRMTSPPPPYVSRGGLKLAAALDAFGIEVTGRRALDVGASTGGFSDCLLQRGAASVVALDVGYGQLDWKVRQDPRVTVFERMNARHMDVVTLGGPFEMIVADLSFISLRTVSAAMESVGETAADWVFLIKPQFEAGKGLVGKGGIVRDVSVRKNTIRTVVDHYASIGLGAFGITDSPIEGAKGNREFLVWLRRGVATLAADQLTNLVGLTDA